MSPDGSKSPREQIPQVYYSRKPSRRDGGVQDVTGSSIDWLRLQIGESGRINRLGAWTESWTLRERERERPVITAERERDRVFLLFCVFSLRVQSYVK